MIYKIRQFLCYKIVSYLIPEQICEYRHTVVVGAAPALTATVMSASKAKQKQQTLGKIAFLASTLEAWESIRKQFYYIKIVVFYGFCKTI